MSIHLLDDDTPANSSIEIVSSQLSFKPSDSEIIDKHQAGSVLYIPDEIQLSCRTRNYGIWM